MTDPFVPQHRPRYTESAFYTTHGERSSDSKEAKVKFDPQQWDLIHKLYISPEDRFGDYKSIHDFVADAIHHRHMWLQREFPQYADDPEMLRLSVMWERRANIAVVASRHDMYQETVNRALAYIDRAEDENGWSSPDAMEQFIQDAEEILPRLEARDAARVLVRLRDAKKSLTALRVKGQLALSTTIDRLTGEESALDAPGDHVEYDPFAVEHDG